jgi:hypothetical protein
MFLPDGIELWRLSTREINARQPTIQPFLSPPYGEPHGAIHRVEARFHTVVAVDRDKENAFFEAGNSALARATETFSRVADAVTAASGTPVSVGNIDLIGGFDQGGRAILARDMFGERVKINSALGGKVAAVYRMLKGSASDDILTRSLRRLVSGARRLDLVDRLVDYVIAWEAILLTQRGTAVTQELAYRFAVNGAALIASIGRGVARRDAYQCMRSAYAARSCVVHGSDETALKKALASGHFRDLGDLCGYLERALRDVLLWLDTRAAPERPYRKKAGWDDLLWAE